MAITLTATFDGKVFVLDGPVDLNIGQKVDVQLPQSVAAPLEDSFQKLVQSWSTEPIDSSVPRDLATQVDHYLYGTPKRDER
jgi:hypothetical protein